MRPLEALALPPASGGTQVRDARRVPPSPSNCMAKGAGLSTRGKWGRWWLWVQEEAGREVWFQPCSPEPSGLGNTRGTLDSPSAQRLQEEVASGVTCHPRGVTHCPCVSPGHTQCPRLLSAQSVVSASGQRQHKDTNLANSCQAPPSTPRVSQTSSYSLHTSKGSRLLHSPSVQPWDNSHPELQCAGHISPLSYFCTLPPSLSLGSLLMCCLGLC